MPTSSTGTLRADIRQVGGTAVIDLYGEVNRDAEGPLTDAWERATTGADAPMAVLLNVERVTYINSTGIAVIVGLLARARKENRSIGVCGLSDHYRTIFEITRLIDFMEVYPDEASAFGGVRAGGWGLRAEGWS